MFSLLDGAKPTLWQPLAKDGVDLPEFYRKPNEARQGFAASETYDFEFVPQRAGELSLETKFADSRTIVPIEVVDAARVSRN